MKDYFIFNGFHLRLLSFVYVVYLCVCMYVFVEARAGYLVSSSIKLSYYFSETAL